MVTVAFMGDIAFFSSIVEASRQHEAGWLWADLSPALQNSDDRVEFAGYLDRQAMWQLYQRADVLLLPTYHPEGMPMVVLEAMACGLGIVCTRTKGLADYLQEGTNALFVPPQRPDILAHRILELISDSERLVRCGKPTWSYPTSLNR